MEGYTEQLRFTGELRFSKQNGNNHFKKAILQRFRYFVNESLCLYNPIGSSYHTSAGLGKSIKSRLQNLSDLH